ncbi:MAG TPA: LuxR C-terminal-related transcriptional regulator [Polyangiaceae bacterium]|nr:LuxR C-terminal-related transcriptional regulator [Polyangiaceae bacterium]
MSSTVLAEAISLGSSANGAGGFLRDGCDLLQRAIGADALLGILQGQEGWAAEHVQGVSSEMMQRLTSRWATYRAELAPVLDVARSEGAAIDVKVMGASLERSAYYRELMEPQAAKSGAIVMLTHRQSVLGAFVLGRRRGFSKRDETRLSELAPALGLGLAALRAFSGEISNFRPRVPEAERNLIEASWPLSPREREFARYVCLGYSNKQIALACGLSPNTVRNRLASVYERLGVSTRAELASLVTLQRNNAR